MFIAVQAGISVVKKQLLSIRWREKEEFHEQNLLSLPQADLFGQPTVVNNVETLCWIPHIVEKGTDWFLKLSLTGEGGTKIYGVSGHVKKPGLWELPMGTTLREIIVEHAGGMQDGYKLRGMIPGGGSTDFMIESHLDTKMDFASVRSAGSRLGTGNDDRTR